MPIAPFQIVNPDGTTNQEEYNRCMEFLQSYIAGTVQVYPELVWDNPYEINEDATRSSLEILLDEIYGGHDTDTPVEVENRLLTVNAFNQFKRFFRGFVKGISRTLIPDPQWLANSNNFIDGPGYRYDIFDFEEPEVIWEYNHLPYVNDDNRTLMGVTCLYNYRATETMNILNRGPSSTNKPYYTGYYYNIPGYQRVENSDLANIPYQGITQQIHGYDCYLLSLFFRTVRQYQQSSGLFYLSYCNDELFTSGYSNYYEPRLERNMYFTINQTQEFEGGKILSGCPLSQVATARANVILNNSALDITKFKATTAPCITPLYLESFKNPFGEGRFTLNPTNGRNRSGYISTYSLFDKDYATKLIPYYRVTSEGQYGIVFSGAVQVVQQVTDYVKTDLVDLSSVNENEYVEITVAPTYDRVNQARTTKFNLTLRLYKQKLIDGPKVGVIDPGDNNTEHIISKSGYYTATKVPGYSGNNRTIRVSLNSYMENFLVYCDDRT